MKTNEEAAQFIEEFTLAIIESPQGDWLEKVRKILSLAPEARELLDAQRRKIVKLEAENQQLLELVDDFGEAAGGALGRVTDELARRGGQY